MTYKLDFKKSALKEWKKLGSTLQQQFKKKLIERLDNPHVPASKLSGADNMYKIKLRQSSYRLVYKVEDDVIIVTVLAVGKRERSDVYRKAMKRLDDWLRYNAALSGEQRRPLHLKYCIVNTKFKVNQKCRALGIRLKCFVSNMA